MKTFLLPLAAVAALAACETTTTTTVSAPAMGSSTDLTAFTGAKAGQAEMGITNLGYTAVRSEGLTTYWYNGQTGACAAITTSDGRYSAVRMMPSGSC